MINSNVGVINVTVSYSKIVFSIRPCWCQVVVVVVDGAAADRYVDVGDLEELGDVEQNADHRHRDKVLQNPSLEGVGVVRGSAVVDRMVHGHVSL